MANYKNKVTVSKLKKAYTTLSQAFQMAESVHGSSEYWEDPYTMGATAYYEKYWKPFFHNATQCKTYRECSYSQISAFHYMQGSASSLSANPTPERSVYFFLPDGTTYMIFTGFGNNNDKVNWIYVDINGGKKPNVDGKDLFKFRYVLGKGIMPDGYNYSTTEIETNCSSGGVGTYCAARIMNDGWKIKY